MTYDIKVLKLGKLSSKRHIYNVDKGYDERNWIYMGEEKESDKRYQIGKNYEGRLTDDI